jgi:hypothetical protein
MQPDIHRTRAGRRSLASGPVEIVVESRSASWFADRTQRIAGRCRVGGVRLHEDGGPLLAAGSLKPSGMWMTNCTSPRASSGRTSARWWLRVTRK